MFVGHCDQNAACGPSPAAHSPSGPSSPLDRKPRAIVSESAHSTRHKPGQGNKKKSFTYCHLEREP